MKKSNDEFACSVLSAVQCIPPGRVTTYGQLACMVGHPGRARLVARVLSHAEEYGSFPCHRVVNHAGRIAPCWPEQAQLLREEGVAFRNETHVELRLSLWSGEI